MISATISDHADLGDPLTVYARGGFQFGCDPLDNPSTDPSILTPGSESQNHTSWGDSAATTPIVIELTKIYSGPEDETATGPNFPRQYTIEVEIADGQTITDLDVTDLLPDNLAYLSLDATSPAGAIIID